MTDALRNVALTAVPRVYGLTGANGLPATVFDAREDGWLSPNNPILVRRSAKILPLAWHGDPQAG